MAIEFDIIVIAEMGDGVEVTGRWIDIERKFVSDANGTGLRSFISTSKDYEKKIIKGNNKDHKFLQDEIEKDKPLILLA